MPKISKSYDILDNFKVDSDTCNAKALKEAFPRSYTSTSQLTLLQNAQGKDICIKLVSDTEEKNLAIANKKGEIHLVDAETAKLIKTLSTHSDDITGIKYIDDLLYSSSLDRSIKCYDKRSGEVVHVYEHKENGIKKPFSCFDVNFSGVTVCGGTPLIKQEDAYIVFWDVRNGNKLLGGYWESHSDDITSVQFHPKKKKYLCSGAMDNMINFYDISQNNESDAFITCINYENTPDVLLWDPNPDYSKNIFAMTYSQLVQYWGRNDTSPIADLSIDKYCNVIMRQDPSACHYISCCFDNEMKPLLMGSSNLENNSQKNQCIRVVEYDRETKKMVPHSLLELSAEKKNIQVYDGIFLPKGDAFVTLQSGSLTFWKEKDDSKRKMSEESCVETVSKKMKV